MGNAGPAILLVCALAGLAISGLTWITYVSHCFLVVVTESSVGDYEVRWPDESIGEMLWKPIYCLGLLVFWLTISMVFILPLFLLEPWVGGIVGGLFLWFIYPLSLLCVMDARSSVAILYMPLVLRLPRQLFAIVFVGFVTLPLMAGAAGVCWLAATRAIYWGFIAVLLVPLAVFFFSRCWGRFAWLVLNVKQRKRAVSGEVVPPEAAQAKVYDPWALPRPEPIPEMEVDVEEEPPPPAPAWDDDEWRNPTPYQVAPSSPEPEKAGATATGAAASTESPVFNHEKYYAEYRKREEERKARAEGRKPGQPRYRKATFGNAFGADLLPFLLQRPTIRAALTLGLSTLATLFFLRIVIVLSFYLVM
jgi:hypothetical protein